MAEPTRNKALHDQYRTLPMSRRGLLIGAGVSTLLPTDAARREAEIATIGDVAMAKVFFQVSGQVRDLELDMARQSV